MCCTLAVDGQESRRHTPGWRPHQSSCMVWHHGVGQENTAASQYHQCVTSYQILCSWLTSRSNGSSVHAWPPARQPGSSDAAVEGRPTKFCSCLTQLPVEVTSLPLPTVAPLPISVGCSVKVLACLFLVGQIKERLKVSLKRALGIKPQGWMAPFRGRLGSGCPLTNLLAQAAAPTNKDRFLQLTSSVVITSLHSQHSSKPIILSGNFRLGAKDGFCASFKMKELQLGSLINGNFLYFQYLRMNYNL